MKKPIKLKKQKLIYIKWHDAFSDNGWKTADQVKEFIDIEYCLCENVGWLIFEDKRELVLSSRRLNWKDIKDTYELGLFQKIPKPWVTERKYLK